jgi:hypothetical protein
VTERDEYADGVNLSAKTLFFVAAGAAPADPNFASRATTKTTVTFEDASSNVLRTENHYFYGAPTDAPDSNPTQFADWWLGLEYKTEVVDPGNSTLQTQQRTYAQRACPGAGEASCPNGSNMTQDTLPAHDPQLCQVNTTTGSATSGVAYLYDQYNNATDEYDFDFGAAPAITASCPATSGALRHTNTTFLTSNATGSYTPASTNILGLPSEVGVRWLGSHLQRHAIRVR